MSDYDFSTLNDKEFEVLVADLLSKEHKHRFERFKPGKDQGVDGRYFIDDSKEVIFQCKHWPNSGLSALLRSLVNDEKNKAIKLAPHRYLLITSLPLSRTDKVKIANAFLPLKVEVSDVKGREDLNQLLKSYPSVVEDNFKLWLHSANVIRIIQNSAIIGRSLFTLQSIREKSAKFVKTKAYFAAKDRLDNSRILLVTGEPGIGKTSIAEQLCLECVAQEYELCVASDNIAELESAYNIERKQIFYFDDFLGSNYLQSLKRNEDSHIIGFIKRIQADKSKKFILTSRTTVLNRGKMLTEKFSNENLQQHEFEINIKEYDVYEKALLLHGFLWFSGLDAHYIEQIIRMRRYIEIINHSNFNPRLISFITDPIRLKTVNATDYWLYIKQKLNNPSDIWGHVFENQIDGWSRTILYLVVTSSNTISEAKLIRAVNRFNEDPLTQSDPSHYDYFRCMNLLVGSLLNRSLINGEAFVSLFNPSIADYVLRRIANEPFLIAGLVNATRSWQAVRRIKTWTDSNVLTSQHYKDILLQLSRYLSGLFSDDGDAYYQSQIASDIIQNDLANTLATDRSIVTVKKISHLPENSRHLVDLARTISKLVEQSQILPAEISGFFENVNFTDFDENDFEEISSAFHLIPSDLEDQVLEEYKISIIAYWQNSIQEHIEERDILANHLDDDDTWDAEHELTDEINKLLSKYAVEFNRADVRDIERHCDVTEIIRGNQKRARNDYHHSGGIPTSINHPADIDDLFAMDRPPNQEG